MKGFFVGLVSSITGEVTDNIQADVISMGIDKIGAEASAGTKHRKHCKFGKGDKTQQLNMVPEEIEEIQQQLERLSYINFENSTCNKHNDSQIEYICIQEKCQTPLCQECIEEHNAYHQQNNTKPIIVNIQERRNQTKLEIKKYLDKVEKLKDYTRNNFEIMDLQDYQAQLTELKNMLLRYINKYFDNLKEKTIKVYEEIKLKEIKQNVLENQFFIAADWSQRLDDLNEEEDFLKALVIFKQKKLEKQMKNLEEQVKQFNEFFKENQPIFKLRNEKVPKQEYFQEVFQDFIEFTGEKVFEQKQKSRTLEKAINSVMNSKKQSPQNDNINPIHKALQKVQGNVKDFAENSPKPQLNIRKNSSNQNQFNKVTNQKNNEQIYQFSNHNSQNQNYDQQFSQQQKISQDFEVETPTNYQIQQPYTKNNKLQNFIKNQNQENQNQFRQSNSNMIPNYSENVTPLLKSNNIPSLNLKSNANSNNLQKKNMLNRQLQKNKSSFAQQNSNNYDSINTPKYNSQISQQYQLEQSNPKQYNNEQNQNTENNAYKKFQKVQLKPRTYSNSQLNTQGGFHQKNSSISSQNLNQQQVDQYQSSQYNMQKQNINL